MSSDILQQRDEATAALEAAEAQLQIKSVETQLKALTRLTEGHGDGYGDDWREIPMPGHFTAHPYFGARNLRRNVTYVDDRTDGKYIPFYENEYDLHRMRQPVRNLATFAAVAWNALDTLANYTFGGEWTYRVQSQEHVEAPPELLAECQRVIDDFLEMNDWQGDLDREIHNSAREDGEFALGLYPQGNGRVFAARHEPEQITEPGDTRDLEDWIGVDAEQQWAFGVHTVKNEQMGRFDYAHPLGYHLIFDNAGFDFDYLPRWPQRHFDDGRGRCMTLFKRNVTRNAARGISDYWPILPEIEDWFKLARNTRKGAAVQAAIAYIIKYGAGTTVSQAESQRSANALLTYIQQKEGSGSQTKYVEKFEPGQIVRTRAGQDFEYGPMGQLRSGVFVEVAQFVLRCIGIRWQMPEYMISGDASNANFASTLVSESPFVKARENDQAFFQRKFRNVMLKVLRIAFIAGRFDRWVRDWSDLRRVVELSIEAPEVASRDKEQMARVAHQQIVDGYLSRQTAAEQQGLDYEQEVDRGASPQSTAPMMGGPRQAAVEAALESVDTTAEARAILEEFYP